MRACGFALGQFGDLVIQTVACRAFKEAFPDSYLLFAIGHPYRDILPLFLNHPDIDDHHIFQSYDDFPTERDREYLSFKKIEILFPGMPHHTSQNWYNFFHYAEETCLMVGLTPPKDLSYELNRWFDGYDNCENVVTLSLFPSKSSQLHKTISIEQAEILCAGLKKMGYRPIQLGGKFETEVLGAENPDLDFLEAARLMTSSKLHISADTCFASIAAGYRHPCLGFYGLNYPDMVDQGSHLPINDNALYMTPENVTTLTAEEILDFGERNFDL